MSTQAGAIARRGRGGRDLAALIGVETRHAMLAAIRQHGDADVVRCTELLLEEGEGPGLGGYLTLLAQRSTHLRRWLLSSSAIRWWSAPCPPSPLRGATVPTGPWSGVPLGVQVIGSRYRADLCLEAAEVIEAQRGLPTPVDPVG